ncbi:MAG TPA: glutathione peroxidase [Hyphomicrobiaceae bacterium]|nr:glutathione peroxidase [Hyphomicrobiaceae bacterium]
MKRLLSAVSAVSMLFGPSVVAAQGAQSGSAHDFSFTSIDGKPMPLSAFKGKVLLVVNTASFCGFTKQYDGLQKLHATYEARGFSVIGVPSNDFGQQEPGKAAEIKTFCETNFNITFPLTDKVEVKGAGAHPFYRWARETLGEAAAPRWNFHKYLVGADGKLIAAFSTQTTPDDARITGAIEKLLVAPKS